MSYKCAITKKQSKVGEPCNKIVVATRAKTYNHTDPETDETWQSFGTEICKEINATAEGLAIWTSWDDNARAMFVKSLY